MTTTGDLDEVLDSLSGARGRTIMSTSAERAANAIREQVVEGLLRSGARLPEERLSAAIGVSRNTLREALSQLVAERILVREPNRGVVVATADADDVRDIYRARRMIEPSVVQHADLGDPSAVEAIVRAVDEGRRAEAQDDWDRVATANQHFHRAIVGLAGSPRLDSQMGLLLAEMRLVFHQMPGVRVFHAPYLRQNASIAAAIAAGDQDTAATDLRRYLATAEQQLLAALGGTPAAT